MKLKISQLLLKVTKNPQKAVSPAIWLAVR